MLTNAVTLTLPSGFTRETGSASELVAELQRLKRPVEDVSFKVQSQQRSRLTGIQIGQLVLHEALVDPAVSKATIDPEPSFLIPFSTGGMIVEDGQSCVMPARTHIVKMALHRPGELHYAPLHVLGIRPNFDALNDAVSSIIGNQSELARIASLDHTSVHPGQIGDTDYVEQLLALVSVVNGSNGDLSLLNRIGISNIFTRVLAEFLVKSVTGSPATIRPEKSTRSKAAVDIICSHIEDNLGTPLTMVRMEKLTGMTGRSLNYAFQERYNCSPQQWQRRYLLDQARKRLIDREDLTSVKAIAYELGFSSASSFASHYNARFGELPSATRSNALANASRSAGGKTEND